MKTKIDWYADTSGMVVGPRVHDSGLTEFAYSATGVLSLAMRRVSGDSVSLELLGVTELSVVELRNGAIISEIFIWNVGAIPDSAWAIPDSPWNLLFSRLLKPDEAKRAAARIIKESPNSFIVSVLSSYGGALAAICDVAAFYEQ